MTAPTHGIPTLYILRIIAEISGTTHYGLQMILGLSAEETEITVKYLIDGGMIDNKFGGLFLTPTGGRTLALMTQADQQPAQTSRVIALYHRAWNAEGESASLLSDLLMYKDIVKKYKKKAKYQKHRIAVLENMLRSKRDE